MRHCPVDELRKVGGELFSRAIEKVRAGEVIIHPGYDGEKGSISIFSPEEHQETRQNSANNGSLIFADPTRHPGYNLPDQKKLFADNALNTDQSSMSEEQQQVINFPCQPLMVNAGAGSGKSYIMLERIARLIGPQGQDSSSLLALLSCKRAAREMRQRLLARLSIKANQLPAFNTFQQLGMLIIAEQHSLLQLPKTTRLLSGEEADELYLRSISSEQNAIATQYELEALLQEKLLAYRKRKLSI